MRGSSESAVQSLLASAYPKLAVSNAAECIRAMIASPWPFRDVPSAVRDAIRAIPPGCPLSLAEFEIVTLIAQGRVPCEIAAARNVRESTVRQQAMSARQKLGAASNAELASVMLASGWFDHIDTDWEDERVTAAQSLYLTAFDRWLRDPSQENTDERAFWLRGIYHEANIIPPWEALGIPQPTRATLAGRNIPPSKPQ